MFSRKKRVVANLPDLDQSNYPDPPINSGQHLIICSVGHGNPEENDILSTFLNLAKQSGYYKPFPIADFWGLLCKGVRNIYFEGHLIPYKKVLSDLVVDEYVEIVECNGKEYLIPAPKFIKMAEDCRRSIKY